MRNYNYVLIRQWIIIRVHNYVTNVYCSFKNSHPNILLCWFKIHEQILLKWKIMLCELIGDCSVVRALMASINTFWISWSNAGTDMENQSLDNFQLLWKCVSSNFNKMYYHKLLCIKTMFNLYFAKLKKPNIIKFLF